MPLVVAEEPGEEPFLSRLVVLSVVELLELRVELDVLPVVLPVVFGESLETLGIEPVPFEPRFIVLEPVEESLPLVPPRFMVDPVEPPLVPPFMPDVPLPLVPPLMPDVPLPLVPPVPLEPPDDCAKAILMVAAKTAAATPAPILVVAFMLFS